MFATGIDVDYVPDVNRYTYVAIKDNEVWGADAEGNTYMYCEYGERTFVQYVLDPLFNYKLCEVGEDNV